jgi:hypothetical protein
MVAIARARGEGRAYPCDGVGGHRCTLAWGEEGHSVVGEIAQRPTGCLAGLDLELG